MADEWVCYEDDLTEWKAFLGFPNIMKWNARALIDAGLRFDAKWLEAALELVGEGLNTH